MKKKSLENQREGNGDGGEMAEKRRSGGKSDEEEAKSKGRRNGQRGRKEEVNGEAVGNGREPVV